MSAEDFFYEVFQDIPFPYFAADLGLLNKNLSKSGGNGFRSHIIVPMDIAPDRRSVLAASWRGFLNNRQVPYALIKQVSASAPLNKSGNGKELLKQANPFQRSVVQETKQGILWEQASSWPIAFSTAIGQLYMITAFHFTAIKERKRELDKMHEENGYTGGSTQIYSEFPRLLPTRVHFAFASLGAWLAGAKNFQYLAYYATIRQVHHEALNRKYLGYMSYDERTIDAIAASGVIAVPERLLNPILKAQGNRALFGSLHIDEQNAANLSAIKPMDFIQEQPEIAAQGLLIDKYYRTPFLARKLEPHGLHGAQNVMRDHYTEFYSSLDCRDLVRCKHYCAPVIEVSSLEEIEFYVDRIPVLHESGIFFRGQPRMYTLQRSAGVRSLLFADSCSVEPSLTTSASRDLTFDYEILHFALRQFVERSLYASDRKLIAGRTERWRTEATSPTCRLDYAIMALAQHYGLPSHGLDVTSSLDVATWFATNRYHRDSTMGIASYEKMTQSDWSSAATEWPVVFACQAVTNSVQSSLQGCEELEDFGVVARRPKLQSAKFFHGGHSDHQNRLAETVVCVFRLRPSMYPTQSNFASLFPGPDEDSAYRLLLDFANENEIWSRYVNRFHQS